VGRYLEPCECNIGRPTIRSDINDQRDDIGEREEHTGTCWTDTVSKPLGVILTVLICLVPYLQVGSQ
jgi:hypothetical protein